MIELELEPIQPESEIDRTERHLFTVTLVVMLALLLVLGGAIAIAWSRGL